MLDDIPSDHPIRAVFRRALDGAFRDHARLYSPDVAEHIGDHVLTDFIRSDRLYRLRDAEGRRVDSIRGMIETAQEDEGPERRIEVDRYIGDFVLFMAGFFPSVLGRGAALSEGPMISRVGKIVVRFERAIDYYVAEAGNAYGRAAATARVFDPVAERTYERLGRDVEGYGQVVSRVKELVEDDPFIREADGIFA